MNRLIRFYNQNRRKIWTVFIAIIFFFIVFRALNELARRKKEENLNDFSQKTVKNTIYTPEKSVISNKTVEKSVFNKHNDLIADFVNLCNNGQIDKAYDLISDDCKQELYSSVDKFKKNYYEDIFNKDISYSIENWADNIYLIKYNNNMLSTGKLTKGGATQDYIKIVNEDGKLKLNINGYLGKEEINKEKNSFNIKIKIISKKSYMDYEIYDIFVQNNNDSRLILDSLDNDKCTYLKDKKGTNHYLIKNEIDRNLLIIKEFSSKNISIKFDNPYINGRKIKSMNFEGIVIGYAAKIDSNFSIDF